MLRSGLIPRPAGLGDALAVLVERGLMACPVPRGFRGPALSLLLEHGPRMIR
jgi:hypothetical protein